MKHIKKFVNNFSIFENNYYYEVNELTDNFVIEDGEYGIELTKEDMEAISEMLTNEFKTIKYNSYISDFLEIYLYDNTLTLIDSSYDTEINIPSSEFKRLLKYINKNINKVAKNIDVFDEPPTVEKEYIEDYIRYARRYNL
jgi:hypothetical protein